MAPKKKKAKVDFSPEAIQNEIRKSRDLIDKVKLFRSGLSLQNISECVRLFGNELGFDIMSLVNLLYGADVIAYTKRALQHVPKAFDCYKNMRKQCVFLIVKRLCPATSLTLEATEDLVDFFEECCKDGLPIIGDSIAWEESLLQLTKEEKWNFSMFIAPPVLECLECQSTLSASNPPSICTVYTLEGPKPSTKITLKCQTCNTYYGCCMFSSSSLSSYYPPHIDSGMFQFILFLLFLYLRL